MRNECIANICPEAKLVMDGWDRPTNRLTYVALLYECLAHLKTSHGLNFSIKGQ